MSKFIALVQHLLSLPESEWVEFKENNPDPDRIGRYISALANSAAIANRSYGYVIWGVNDRTRTPVGTTFEPQGVKAGNEELEGWLNRVISPNIGHHFTSIEYEGHNLVVLTIPRASATPVAFKGIEYVRVGSYTKSLRDAPDKARQLWRSFERVPFERQFAMEGLDVSEALSYLDAPAYFDLMKMRYPATQDQVAERLLDEQILAVNEGGELAITNLGAILFAKRLDAFGRLSRKAIRVIRYEGTSKSSETREQTGTKGYAAGIEGLLGYINSFVPRNEAIGQALRTEAPMYPELAIRELVVNALIHQDFDITGTGPMIEIYPDRIEITNPGKSLNSVDRLLDKPSRSRNEAIASLMRTLGICEERGSGIDKVVELTEIYQLPAPEFIENDDSFRATLFSHRSWADMDKADRLRATYLHACLRHVIRDYMTNSSLRERLGVDARNAAAVSRLINDAIQEGLIRPYREDAGKKYAKYVPFWAAI